VGLLLLVRDVDPLPELEVLRVDPPELVLPLDAVRLGVLLHDSLVVGEGAGAERTGSGAGVGSGSGAGGSGSGVSAGGASTGAAMMARAASTPGSVVGSTVGGAASAIIAAASSLIAAGAAASSTACRELYQDHPNQAPPVQTATNPRPTIAATPTRRPLPPRGSGSTSS